MAQQRPGRKKDNEDFTGRFAIGRLECRLNGEARILSSLLRAGLMTDTIFVSFSVSLTTLHSHIAKKVITRGPTGAPKIGFSKLDTMKKNNQMVWDNGRIAGRLWEIDETTFHLRFGFSEMPDCPML